MALPRSVCAQLHEVLKSWHFYQKHVGEDSLGSARPELTHEQEGPRASLDQPGRSHFGLSGEACGLPDELALYFNFLVLPGLARVGAPLPTSRQSARRASLWSGEGPSHELPLCSEATPPGPPSGPTSPPGRLLLSFPHPCLAELSVRLALFLPGGLLSASTERWLSCPGLVLEADPGQKSCRQSVPDEGWGDNA